MSIDTSILSPLGVNLSVSLLNYQLVVYENDCFAHPFVNLPSITLMI